MASIENKKQVVVNTTQVLYNNQEVGFEEDFNIKYVKEPKYIFFVENCRRKERKSLDKDLVPKVKKDILFWKKKYPKTKVIHLFQFKKGLLKTKDQIKYTRECQEVNNSNGVCFYEELPGQEAESFEKQLGEFLKFNLESDKYIVLEINSEDVAEKISIALREGLRNFIFISGDYENFDLWTTLTSSIREAGGKSFILLLARMHNYTKESYIKKALGYGFDYVIHGMAFGGGNKNKNRIVRFLDGTDLVYKSLTQLNDNNLNDIVSQNCSNKQEQYELSRVLAIDKANLFIKTHTPKKVVKA